MRSPPPESSAAFKFKLEFTVELVIAVYVYTASQMSVRAFELTKRWGPVRTHRQPVSQARDILVYKGYIYVADLIDGLLIFKTVE